MYFRQILHEERACASYLVGCPTRGLCAVIDPQGDPQDYIEPVEHKGMIVSHIIETHLHADHISCARELSALTSAPIYLGPGTQVNFEHVTLSDGQVLEIGNRRLKVFHTPGHTPEHICLLGDDWYLLTGDTLFVGDVGRVDLALSDIPVEAIQGRAEQLRHSLRKLLGLPDYVEVYPGHYAGSVCGRGMDGKTISTIGHERRGNHALQLSDDEFARFQTEGLPALPDDFHSIKRRNLGYE